MLKYYFSSEYRKNYAQLQKMNLLDDNLSIQPYNISNYIYNRSQTKKQQDQNRSKSIKKQDNNNKSTSKIDHKNRSNSNTKRSQQATICSITQNIHYQLLINNDFQIFRNLSLSPIKIFKILYYIHFHFILIRNNPLESQSEKIQVFFKWILNQSIQMGQKLAKKERKISMSKQKKQKEQQRNSVSKNQSIIVNKSNNNNILNSNTNNENMDNNNNNNKKDYRPVSRPKSSSVNNNSYLRPQPLLQQSILNKQIYLLSHIIKPYILYLQKLLSCYQYYQRLLHSLLIQFQQQDSWSILNIFRLMTGVTINFNHIGRYFYKQYSAIIYLMIQLFSKQTSRFYPKLSSIITKKLKQIQHQYYILLNTYSEYQIYHNENIQIKQTNNMVILIDQMIKTNDALYLVYMGKYFYKGVNKLRIQQPQWFEINSKQCQFIIYYNKNKIKTNKRNSLSKDKKNNIITSNHINHIHINNQINQSDSKNINQSDSKNNQTQPSSSNLNLFKSKNNIKKQQNEQKVIVIQKNHFIPKVKNQLKLSSRSKGQNSFMKQFISQQKQKYFVYNKKDNQNKQNQQNQQTVTFRIKKQY